ncbi:MAG: cobalamin B12-binding domain-containing protein [Elusimicrobia bacterium]|nr:cobalamin B12-binding domain-containing protein [Elusimicrobiota bacterium]
MGRAGRALPLGSSHKKVFLIGIPSGHIYGKIKISLIKYGVPPIGLACLGAFLSANGIPVELFDLQYLEGGWETVFERIRRDRPGIVGFSAVTPAILSIAKVAKVIKEIDPGIKVVVGGPHPSALPEESLGHGGIDVAVLGEGEQSLLELAQGRPLETIQGICYLDSDGRARLNPPRPLIEDLDSLPMPAYDLLPYDRYGYIALDRSLIVYSGRGCPFNCSFCATRVISKNRYRVNSPEYFVSMLERLKRDFGISRFVIGDESFTSKPERVVEICELILHRNLSIRWNCLSRVDHITREVARTLKKAGCKMVEIGIESGDERVLRETHKGISLAQVEKAVDILAEEGLESYGYFMLGLPYETVESMRRTIAFAKKLRLDFAQFAMFVPFPGSSAWTVVQEGKVLRCYGRDWDDYCRFQTAIVGSDAVPPALLQEYYRKALKEFYFRPVMAGRVLQKCRSLDDIAMFLRMGLTFLAALRNS